MKSKQLLDVKNYILARKNVIILYLVWNIITVTIMLLYNVLISSIIYAIFLPLFLTLFIGLIDGASYFNKLAKIRQMKDYQFNKVDLVEKADEIERNYLEKLQEMYLKHQSLEATYDQQQTDLSDYYTLWSHQIKTPLAAIKLLLEEGEVLNTTLLSQELLKIETYVESALHFAKLQSVTSDFDFQNVDLDHIIKQVIKKYSTFFIYKNISLYYEQKSIDVLTDEKWLSFVIEQILSNALKYTKSGCISIEFEEEQKQLIIKDTGIGIKEEDIHRVFEKGFTGFNGRMDKQSTGIGLYLTKKILEKMNNKIHIQSKVSEGTTITILLARIDLEND